jgi:hypothetical protein
VLGAALFQGRQALGVMEVRVERKSNPDLHLRIIGAGRLTVPSSSGRRIPETTYRRSPWTAAEDRPGVPRTAPWTIRRTDRPPLSEGVKQEARNDGTARIHPRQPRAAVPVRLPRRRRDQQGQGLRRQGRRPGTRGSRRRPASSTSTRSPTARSYRRTANPKLSYAWTSSARSTSSPTPGGNGPSAAGSARPLTANPAPAGGQPTPARTGSGTCSPPTPRPTAPGSTASRPSSPPCATSHWTRRTTPAIRSRAA